MAKSSEGFLGEELVDWSSAGGWSTLSNLPPTQNTLETNTPPKQSSYPFSYRRAQNPQEAQKYVLESFKWALLLKNGLTDETLSQIMEWLDGAKVTLKPSSNGEVFVVNVSIPFVDVKEKYKGKPLASRLFGLGAQDNEEMDDSEVNSCECVNLQSYFVHCLLSKQVSGTLTDEELGQLVRDFCLIITQIYTQDTSKWRELHPDFKRKYTVSDDMMQFALDDTHTLQEIGERTRPQLKQKISSWYL